MCAPLRKTKTHQAITERTQEQKQKRNKGSTRTPQGEGDQLRKRTLPHTRRCCKQESDEEWKVRSLLVRLHSCVSPFSFWLLLWGRGKPLRGCVTTAEREGEKGITRAALGQKERGPAVSHERLPFFAFAGDICEEARTRRNTTPASSCCSTIGRCEIEGLGLSASVSDAQPRTTGVKREEEEG